MLRIKIDIKYILLFTFLYLIIDYKYIIYIFNFYEKNFNSKITFSRCIDYKNCEYNILNFANMLDQNQKYIFYTILEDVKKIEFHKANIDDLSRLYNRRGFNKIFENSIEKYKKKLK